MNFIKKLFGIEDEKHELSCEDLYDTYFNELLSKYTFKNCTEHTADLGPITFWVANHPGSSFTTYIKGKNGNIKPKKESREKAYKLYMTEYMKVMCQEYDKIKEVESVKQKSPFESDIEHRVRQLERSVYEPLYEIGSTVYFSYPQGHDQFGNKQCKGTIIDLDSSRIHIPNYLVRSNGLDHTVHQSWINAWE